MVNNYRAGWLPLALGLAVLVGGCRGREPEGPPVRQGVIEFDETVLSFEVAGRVGMLKMDVGDPVKQGQLLAELDDTLELRAKDLQSREAESADAQLRLVRAGSRPEEIRAASAKLRAYEATVAHATEALERERKLFAKGASVQARIDDLEATVDRARAERDAQEQQLDALKRGARREEIEAATSRAQAASAVLAVTSTKIDKYDLRSPVKGTVVDVFVNEGEVVSPRLPVAVVADTRKPFADIFVPQGQIDGCHVGTKASVRVDGSEATWTGQVEHISRRTEFTPRYLFSEKERANLVIRVRVRIDDPEERLHAGVPASVVLDMGHP